MTVVTWTAVLATSVGCYLMKLAGLSVPASWLEWPVLARVAALLPVALLAALVGVLTVSTGRSLVLDARAAGVAAGAVAVLLRAPFLVVVSVAAVVAAGVRAFW